MVMILPGVEKLCVGDGIRQQIGSSTGCYTAYSHRRRMLRGLLDVYLGRRGRKRNRTQSNEIRRALSAAKEYTIREISVSPAKTRA